MKPPLIIIELDSLDITFVQSTDEIVSSVEPYDIDNVALFDVEGLVLNLVIKKVKRREFFIEFEASELSLVPSSVRNEEGLRHLLIEHFARRGKLLKNHMISTKELIALVEC